MKRTRFALLVAGAIVAPLSLVLAPVDQAFAAQPTSNDAIQQFGSCLSSGGRGDLLLLLDTSSSLRESDSQDDRVGAAKYLVEQLAEFAGSAKAKIDVSIAGFDSDYHPGTAWQQLSTASAGSVANSVQDYAQRDTGRATDYWKALIGARKALAAKSGGSGDCQALVWFTDGKLDIDPQYDTAPKGIADYGNAWAQRDLCAPRGVASQLRQQGITTLAIGLGGSQNFGLMKGIAEGVSGCGAPTPGHSPGVFVPAADVAGLFVAFDAIADPQHPPSIAVSDLCVKDIGKCTGVPFVLDPFVSKVTILGVSDVQQYGATLIAPSGKQWTIDSRHPAPRKLGSVKITSGSPPGTTALRIKLVQGRNAADDWTGQWKLVFFSKSDGTATSSLRLYDDVTPVWTPANRQWRLKDTQKVKIGLVHDGSGRTTIDPATLPPGAGLDLTGSIQYADGQTVQFAKIRKPSDLAKSWQVPLQAAAPGAATVTLSLRYTTAPSGDVMGTTFEPQTSSTQVLIKAPGNYPKLPSLVDFGSGDKVGRVTKQVAVAGSGCAWVSKPAQAMTAPSGVTPTVTSSATDQKSCVAGTLPLTLTVDKLGTGLISGQVAVATKPASGGPSISVPVRFTYELDYPADPKTFWAALVGVTALGIAIPVLLLYLVKWRGAKIPGTTLSVGLVSGIVSESHSFLGSTSLQPRELRVVPLEGADRRRVEVSPRAALVTRMGLGLTEPGYVLVEGAPAVTSTGSASTARRRARLPLAVHDHWVALLDPASPQAGEVQVVFITDPSSVKLAELLNDARNQVPERIARLRETLPGDEPQGKQEPDDWGASRSPNDSPGGRSVQTPPSSTGSPASTDDW